MSINAKKLLFRLGVGLFSLLIAVAPTISIYALDSDTLKFFATNNIVYYDPTPRRNCSSRLDCHIAGETRDEKLWSGLRNIGFTPEQTAALMGNILHEGGTPTRQEDVYIWARNNGCNTLEGTPYTIWDDSTNGQHHGACMAAHYSRYANGNGVAGIGLGFVQWTSHDRRLGYLDLMEQAGLLKYFDGDAYKVYGSLSDDALRAKIVEETGSEDDYWALWCTALKYIFSELTAGHASFFNMTDVAEMAGYIAANYEVCGDCQPGNSSYNDRVTTAGEVYSRYQSGDFSSVESTSEGSADVLAGDALTDGSKVTIIGDSITNGARSKISSQLPNADIVAQDSKQFAGSDASNPTGQEIVTSMQSAGTLRPTVVVALGTNNAGLTTDQIDALVAAAGEGHKILFVNNYDNKAPTKYDSNNSLFDAAAVTHDNVSVVNWKQIVTAAISENPGTTYLKDENSYAVHVTDAGAELFAKTIVDAINGANRSLSTCNEGMISDPSQAISYLQQFIVDTNHRYGTNYILPPADLAVGVAAPTPADDTPISGGCWGATYCGQCTALSGWFVTMMSNFNYGGGNGKDVVGNLVRENGGAALYSVRGEYPDGVAIFSTTMGSPEHGHTGVIMGKDSDGNYITIENNMRGPDGAGHHLMIRTFSAASLSSNNTSFYPIDIVKVEHLGTTY